MQYDSNTVLKDGPYKWKALKDVPSIWLIQFYTNFKKGANPNLYTWIENNLHTIIHNNKQVPVFCNKLTFPTEESVRKRLFEIRRIEQERKKPQRYYKCDTCGGYHLTSKQLKK